MARIDVRCCNDHISEVDRSISLWPATPPCPECQAATEQIHLPPQVTWSIDPVIVFRAPDGSFRFPGGTDALSTGKYEKAGLTRIELRSAADVRRFEGQMNQREMSRASRRVERMHEARSNRESETRSELRRQMTSMSTFGQRLARAAVDRNNAKPAPRTKETGFHLQAFSYDRSNREESRDSHGRRRRD